MPRADRLAPALPGVLGAVEVLLGVWMVSPHSFFDAIGPFQAYDPRYVRDVSTFSPAIGIAGGVTDDEHCPELAETDPQRLAELYEDVTPRMRAVLDLLLDRGPGERLTFAQVELELGWPRGRFASVFGGFRGRRGKEFKRPFRLCEPRRSAARAWELWLDEGQARALRARAGRPGP